MRSWREGNGQKRIRRLARTENLAYAILYLNLRTNSKSQSGVLMLRRTLIFRFHPQIRTKWSSHHTATITNVNGFAIRLLWHLGNSQLDAPSYHAYTYQIHYQLKFSGFASEVFSRIRDRVDTSIAELIPDAVKRLTWIYENLRSENSENWSNAAHSCRRILRDLADAIFPVQTEPRVKSYKGKNVTIDLGADDYINRVICYVEDNINLLQPRQ